MTTTELKSIMENYRTFFYIADFFAKDVDFDAIDHVLLGLLKDHHKAYNIYYDTVDSRSETISTYLDALDYTIEALEENLKGE